MSACKKLDTDDLTGIALKIDAIRGVFDDLIIDFFDAFNPEKEDPRILAYCFAGARSRANAVQILLADTEKELKQLGIYLYEKGE